MVEAVRMLAGVWKNDPAPLSGGAIPAAHFAELCANLNPALSALGIKTLPDDQTLGASQPVRAVHIQAVRDKVR